MPSRLRWLVGLALIAAVAILRITATYRIFNQTYDEPAHIATGMEWLDRGTYTYERLHPPLARIAAAAGPYLDGVRSYHNRGMWREGNTILHARGTYWRNLTLARAGILPFFLAAVVIVFVWARSLSGGRGGLFAAGALSLVPPILAHAGIATTDMASAATITGALLGFVAWLERPTAASGALLGTTAGLAAVTKLSALVYLPAAGAAALAAYLAWRPPDRRPSRRRRAFSLGMAAVTAVLVLAAAYRFSFGPLMAARPVDTTKSALRRAAEWVAQRPIFPAPDYVRGLVELRSMNRTGRKNYVMGSPEREGRWYFFPFALAVKTPLPFLALALTGGVLLLVAARRHHHWQAAVPPAAAMALLGAAMVSNINIGVRHVLPVYLPLAVCAGVTVTALWRAARARTVTRGLAVFFVGWLVWNSARAHPEYLAYFNELGGSHPEEMLLDSDLDWGQDLARLADTLRARGVDRLSITYHGSADLTRHGLPPFTVLEPNTPVSGWVAASVYRVRLGYMGGSHFDTFGWLRQHTPVARVGKSILLYWVRPATHSAAASAASDTRPSSSSGGSGQHRAPS